jgi:hypothetical protein
MFDDLRRWSRAVAANRPYFDSGKNPRLASGDETPRRCLRKFFYCQKSRLRVRASAIRTDFWMPREIDRATIVDIANTKTTTVQGDSCNLAKMTSISPADFSHRGANAFALLRLPCVARARLEASILP